MVIVSVRVFAREVGRPEKRMGEKKWMARVRIVFYPRLANLEDELVQHTKRL